MRTRYKMFDNDIVGSGAQWENMRACSRWRSDLLANTVHDTIIIFFFTCFASQRSSFNYLFLALLIVFFLILVVISPVFKTYFLYLEKLYCTCLLALLIISWAAAANVISAHRFHYCVLYNFLISMQRFHLMTKALFKIVKWQLNVT